MDFHTYVPLALKTEAPFTNLMKNLFVVSDTESSADKETAKRLIRSLHAAIGLCTETGELLLSWRDAGSAKRMDQVNTIEEVGDLWWYTALFFDANPGLIVPSGITGTRVVKTILKDLTVSTSELLDVYKKWLFGGKTRDLSFIQDNFSPVFVEIVLLGEAFGLKEDEVRGLNIEKLQDRHKKGSFDPNNFDTRDTETERKIVGRKD